MEILFWLVYSWVCYKPEHHQHHDTFSLKYWHNYSLRKLVSQSSADNLKSVLDRASAFPSTKGNQSEPDYSAVLFKRPCNGFSPCYGATEIVVFIIIIIIFHFFIFLHPRYLESRGLKACTKNSWND